MSIVFQSPFWSFVGLSVLLMFAIIFVTLVVGMSLVNITGASEKTFTWFQVLLLASVAVVMLFTVAPSFYQIVSVKSLSNGSWQLKNGFGWPVATLPKQTERDIYWESAKMRSTIGTVRFYTAYTVSIATRDHVYMSINLATEEKAQALTNQLADMANQTGASRTQFSEDTPLSFWQQNYQIIKYSLWGAIALLLIGAKLVERFSKKIS